MKDPIKEKLKRQEERKKQTIESHSFADGLVECQIGIDGSHLTIYQWRSFDEKKGNTTQVLKSFRKKYKKITIADIGGYPEDDSWKYWLYIRSKGLVDILRDSYGDEVFSL
jgi:hypothetical protein